MKQTFKKDERLHSKKKIEKLFTVGDSFFQYPFKVIYFFDNSDDHQLPQVLISVSKRSFKRAVDRNSLKRLIREAYRKNKSMLCEAEKEKNSALLLGLIYTGKTMLAYAEIDRKIILILQRLKEKDEQAAG